MNPNCPYCQMPARYDLEPAEELNTVSTRYQKVADGTSTWRMVETDVVVMGHRSRHPIKDQPQFHIPCQNGDTQ